MQKYIHLVQIVETEKIAANQLRHQLEDQDTEIERLKSEVAAGGRALPLISSLLSSPLNYLCHVQGQTSNSRLSSWAIHTRGQASDLHRDLWSASGEGAGALGTQHHEKLTFPCVLLLSFL